MYIFVAKEEYQGAPLTFIIPIDMVFAEAWTFCGLNDKISSLYGQFVLFITERINSSRWSCLRFSNILLLKHFFIEQIFQYNSTAFNLFIFFSCRLADTYIIFQYILFSHLSPFLKYSFISFLTSICLFGILFFSGIFY